MLAAADRAALGAERRGGADHQRKAEGKRVSHQAAMLCLESFSAPSSSS